MSRFYDRSPRYFKIRNRNFWCKSRAPILRCDVILSVSLCTSRGESKKEEELCVPGGLWPWSYATQPAGTMKSKTSESLIASESKAGIRRDGADEHKQKQLKKGKGTDGTKTDELFPRSRAFIPWSMMWIILYFTSVSIRL